MSEFIGNAYSDEYKKIIAAIVDISNDSSYNFFSITMKITLVISMNQNYSMVAFMQGKRQGKREKITMQNSLLLY